MVFWKKNHKNTRCGYPMYTRLHENMCCHGVRVEENRATCNSDVWRPNKSCVVAQEQDSLGSKKEIFEYFKSSKSWASTSSDPLRLANLVVLIIVIIQGRNLVPQRSTTPVPRHRSKPSQHTVLESRVLLRTDSRYPREVGMEGKWRSGLFDNHNYNCSGFFLELYIYFNVYK